MTTITQAHPALHGGRARLDPDGGTATAAREIVPVAVAIASFSMSVGATIASTEVDHFVGWLGGPLLVGGSSHVAAVTLLDAGAAAGAVILTALLINLRVVAYSAILARHFARQPRWFRWVAAAMLVDQTFATVSTHAEQGRDDAWLRRYYLAFSIPLWCLFIVGVGAGIVAGPIVPASLELGFSGYLLFIAMLMPAARTRPAWAAAVVAFVTAGLLASLPAGLGLVLGGLAGAVTGAALSAAGDRPTEGGR